MRIAINARLLQKGRMEGIARYIYEVTRRMVANHPEDEFIFLFDRPYDSEFIFADNVTAVQIGIPARLPILFKLWFEYFVPKSLKEYNADVFLGGDGYLSIKSNVPTVLVSHDLAYIHFPEHLPKHHLRYYKKFFPKFHKKADQIIAVSESTKADIIKQFDIAEENIKVGHNASPAGFAPVSESVKSTIRKLYSDDKPYFIYLGSLHPRKNIVALIEAFTSFKNEYQTDHQLVIVGRMAWNFESIKIAFDKSAYKHNIHMYHNIKDEAKNILASAEALLYISTFEGFGIPILEAFSSGTAVITSDISSMPEVAGDAALLVSPFDTNQIAEAMHSITSDPLLKKSLIDKGFKRLTLFDWDKTAETIYNSLVEIKK